MTEQQRDAEKESYFASFNELKRRPLPENQRKAYEAAVEYLKRFEGDNDPDARTVRAFVTNYERAGRQLELFKVYEGKKYLKAFELGRAMLKTDPDNFFVLSILTEAGIDNAQAGDPSLNEATLTYGQKALQLLEAGKVTKSEPFKDVEVARGYLNSAIGTLIKDKSPAEAAQAYRKAAQSNSFYRDDPIIYHRLGISILKGEFAQLSNEYNQKFGSQRASPEQQAMLQRIIKLAEQAIDAYARAVALSDPARATTIQASETATPRTQFPPELRAKILEQLTALYKNFHNGSDAGLAELIAGVLTKPMP
ncbi:MAG TPA: hypothetical protein VJU86_07365 [Pyrinomonadaceae bacterium]|nr:hypothetical protein [Pyrinomonadaceae bacterium]